MRLELSIVSQDGATPVLAEVQRRLHSRVDLNRRIAEGAEVYTRDYLALVQARRHRTADDLGATRTGFFERAAESPEGRGTSEAALLTLRPRAAFARAFREVTIVPTGGKKFLTIPVHRDAYGKRAGEIDGLDFVQTGTAAVLGKKVEGTKFFITYYVLVKQVIQSQERDLLPSDEDFLFIAEEAAKDYLLARTGGDAPPTAGGTATP